MLCAKDTQTDGLSVDGRRIVEGKKEPTKELKMVRKVEEVRVKE